MAENKTQSTGEDVLAFLERVPDPERRDDARRLCAMMEKATGEPPLMWGTSIVGFGRYRYKYESGREGESMLIGFSPRAKELVLYVMDGFPQYEQLLARLGRHKTGKSCLYVKKLSDVDEEALEALIRESAAHMRERHPAPASAG